MRITFLLLAFVLFSCKKDDDDINNNNGNPFIQNAVFDTGGFINTNLPQFNQLRFPGNSVTINSGNFGINGIVVFYAGGENYSAFELSDPNHMIKTCSALTVNNAIATCTCEDGNSYEVVGGLPLQGTTGEFPLVRYRVEVNGNIIRVFNN